MRRMLMLSLIMVWISAPIVAQNVLTPEKMLELERVGAPVASPDGQHVVYTVSDIDAASNGGTTTIYIQAINSTTPVALGTGSSPMWRPDGKKIGFMRGGQLWEMDPDGQNASQVTSFDFPISNVSYAPNGTFLAFTRTVKLDELATDKYPDLDKANARLIDGLMYRHWDTFHNGTYSHLFYAPYSDGALTGDPIDLMAGEPYDTPLKPFGGAAQITWSPDSGSLVYTSKKLTGAEAAFSTNSDLYQYTLATGETRNLTESNPGYDFYPAFSPDGSRLAWLSMETPGYEADRYRLMLMDMASGNVRELSTGFDQNVNGHVWSADGSRIYFQSGKEATVQIYYYDSRTRRADPNIYALTSGVHDYTGIALAGTAQQPVIIASRMSMSAPSELFKVDVSNGEASAFTEFNKEHLSELTLGEVTSRWVETTDGKRMKVWVILPPNFDPNKKYPTLLYAQGGPQGTVSQFFSYRWNFQVIAAQGYVVVAPNRRGLPSFGQEWNLQISGDWGGQAMKDMLAAIDNVSAEPWADESRMGAVGASFGGYTVFWLAGNHEKRFKTFISHAGIFHLESMYGETEEMFFINFDMDGAWFDSPRPSSYDLHSPHLFVQNWDTPIMMIHGERDYRVPVGQSFQAFTTAQRMGIPSKMVLFPGENHWILTPQNSLLWHREFFGWLDQWLKD